MEGSCSSMRITPLPARTLCVIVSIADTVWRDSYPALPSGMKMRKVWGSLSISSAVLVTSSGENTPYRSASPFSALDKKPDRLSAVIEHYLVSTRLWKEESQRQLDYTRAVNQFS